jgi:hypothetical protein
MINFKGDDAWFLPNVHKSHLSNYPLNRICEDSFTFCVRTKINWDKMEADTMKGWGGIMMRNGMHSGLVAVKSKSSFAINGEVWTNIDGNPTPKTIYLRIHENDKDSWLDLTYIYEIKGVLTIMSDKSVSLDWDNVAGANKSKHYYSKQLEIKGNIIDYRDSWLWLGCANAFGGCDEEHRQYLQGKISHIGIFGKKLDEHEVKSFFDSCDSGLENTDLNDLVPVSYTDFITRTPYKSFDYSGNGNHIVEYNPDWGAL